MLSTNLIFDAYSCFIDGDADEYALPYSERVPHDPSIDDMKRVVVEEKARPQIPKRLSGHLVSKPLSHSIIFKYFIV